MYPDIFKKLSSVVFYLRESGDLSSFYNGQMKEDDNIRTVPYIEDLKWKQCSKIYYTKPKQKVRSVGMYI